MLSFVQEVVSISQPFSFPLECSSITTQHVMLHKTCLVSKILNFQNVFNCKIIKYSVNPHRINNNVLSSRITNSLKKSNNIPLLRCLSFSVKSLSNAFYSASSRFCKYTLVLLHLRLYGLQQLGIAFL